MRTAASISDGEALTAFQKVLDAPVTALAFAVVVGTKSALVVFAGEDEMFTDLAFSMAGPQRAWAFAQARRMAASFADPDRHSVLEAERRRERIAVGKYLIALEAEEGDVEELDWRAPDLALWGLVDD
jgi:hypothetical protein